MECVNRRVNGANLFTPGKWTENKELQLNNYNPASLCTDPSSFDTGRNLLKNLQTSDLAVTFIMSGPIELTNCLQQPNPQKSYEHSSTHLHGSWFILQAHVHSKTYRNWLKMARRLKPYLYGIRLSWNDYSTITRTFVFKSSEREVTWQTMPHFHIFSFLQIMAGDLSGQWNVQGLQCTLN